MLNQAIVGLDIADWLIGSSQSDVLVDLAGNDTLFGQEGDDLLIGGKGSDVLEGGQGSDTLAGGQGNDTLLGNGGVNYLYGGTDDDVYVLDPFYHLDSLNIIFEFPNQGKDTVFSSYAYALPSDVENLHFLDRFPSLAPLMGEGNELNNFLYGNDGKTVLLGHDGNDTLYGDHSLEVGDNDTLVGGKGKDVLYGMTRSDFLFGDDGNDSLYGGTGSDFLNGGGGNDILKGAGKTELFYSDFEMDTLIGGDGEDRFILTEYDIAGTQDFAFIQDFNPLKDALYLKALDPQLVSNIYPAWEVSNLFDNSYTVVGNSIYTFTGDLIAQVQGNFSLNLNADYVVYI